MAPKACLTLTLDDDLIEQVKREAGRRRVSASAVVRWAIEAYFLPGDTTGHSGGADAASRPSQEPRASI